MRRVAVVGVGQTRCVMRREDADFPGLIFEATEAALKDAGLRPADVGAVVFGSSPEYFEGVNHPEKWCVDGFAGQGKPHFRIHTGGTVGAATGIAAFYHVASGAFDVVLAVTGDKLSECPVQAGLSTVYDPIFGRQFACGAPAGAALQARAYMDKYGITEEQCAKVAVKNRLNAIKNPYAQLKFPDITVEKVLASPMISSPIRLLDSCPTSDGACAIVLAAEGRAEALCKKPAWVHGVSAIAEGVNYSRRDWAEPIALLEAAKRAYAMAGISDPRRQVDVAEVYDAFSYQELLWSEALYFCERGEGGRLVDEGVTSLSGDLPINASGGVLSTNTIGASALQRQAEVALQIMGKAGEHQLPNVRTGVAHGWGGAIQFQAVMVLSGRKP